MMIYQLLLTSKQGSLDTNIELNNPTHIYVRLSCKKKRKYGSLTFICWSVRVWAFELKHYVIPIQKTLH